jgi:hypothetical protein
MAPHGRTRHARRSRFHFSESLGPSQHADGTEMMDRCLNHICLMELTSRLLVIPPSLLGCLSFLLLIWKGPGVPNTPIHHVRRLALNILNSLGLNFKLVASERLNYV